MKKLLSVAFLALALTTACKKEAVEGGIIVRTHDVTLVSAVSAELWADVSFRKSSDGWEYGFQYSTSPDFSNPVSREASFDKGEFWLTLTGLTPSTRYYCRAYLCMYGTYYYGEIKEFTTLSLVLETLEAETTEGGGVRLYARLDIEGFGVFGSSYHEYGFYVGTSADLQDQVFNGNKQEDDIFYSDIPDTFTPGRYWFKAFLTVAGETYYGGVKSFDISMSEIVDLGLSVQWRAWNLGASSMTDFGDYFAWGELQPYYKRLDPIDWEDGKQAGYDWGSYGLCSGTSNSLTSYVTMKEFGTVDGRTILVPSISDPAYQELGGDWRIPTPEEWEELRVGCECSLESVNGVPGVKFTSRLNGKWIFIPAAGYFSGLEKKETGTIGDYWSSKVDAANPIQASVVEFGSDYFSLQTKDRCIGLPIRPVLSSKQYVPVEVVSAGKPAFTLLQWEPAHASATVIPEDADEKKIIWTSSDESIVRVSQSGEIKAVSLGTATLTAACGGVTAEVPVYVVENAPFVDLGVSAKWAPYNLCESGFVDAITDWGDFYAWGEIEPHYSSLDPLTWKDGYADGYEWSNYKWCGGSSTSLTKYNWTQDCGVVDNKNVLEMGPDGDDAASRKLGLGWRIPTKEDWQDLREKCDWAVWTMDGQTGYKVTSRKDSSKWIFLPICGYFPGYWQKDVDNTGVYWSSTVSSDNPGSAWVNNMYSTSPGGVSGWTRSDGILIRPVTN